MGVTLPWLERFVVSFTDNVVAEAAMRAASPRAEPLAVLTARRSLWLYSHGVVEEVRRVTSSANLWADIGSRPEYGGADEVERQAVALGLRVLRVPVPSGWSALEATGVA